MLCKKATLQGRTLLSPSFKSLLKEGKSCAKGSSISKIYQVLENGILRIGGQLSKMCLQMELKHPMIILKDFHISILVLRHILEQVGHSGQNHMLSRLSQRYWIPCVNSQARKTIKSCLFCRCLQARVREKKMPDLPQDPFSPDLPPFTHVGIDYFGPIEVK